MFEMRSSSCAVLGASLLLTTSLGLAGCSGALISSPIAPNAVPMSGNWQIASTAPVAAKLPSLSGELSGSSISLSGIFHSNSPASCVAPNHAIELTGSANAMKRVTLTGANVAGGTLTITGTLASDGKSLTSATYNVTGGACAFGAPADGSMQLYSSIDGNYTGSFADKDGQVITLTATLSQTPASDTSGNFQLSGTGTFPNNPCFNSPVSISNSQVTGGSFNLTYSDATTGSSVDTSGTFSTDGRTLTVTQWTLSGPCGPDTGTGTLAQ